MSITIPFISISTYVIKVYCICFIIYVS